MTADPLVPENELVSKAKLEIRDGRIHYRLYQQDGTMQPMDCADTASNRLCVSWFQAYDRYTPGGGMPLGMAMDHTPPISSGSSSL